MTPDSALRISAVYACVRIIAETIATLPLNVYERLSTGGKRKAVEHPLYRLIHSKPNQDQTSVEWREMIQAHILLRGNAYCQLIRNAGGRTEAIVPIHPDRVRPYRAGNDVLYEIQAVGGGSKTISMASDILHIRGLSSDGLLGLSPVTLARESMGLAMAVEEYGARLYSNNARPGGILTHPGKLQPESAQRLKNSWQAAHSGLSNAHKVAVLEEGMTWHQIGLAATDAQFIESRKFQLQEIARVYRVPPHLLADLDRATFSNVEHAGIEFVTYTIRPWLVRWEQSLEHLFPESEKGRYFAEFTVDGLLRGDATSRFSAYSVGRQWGWLCADDVRELENMNPLPDNQGQIFMVPLNMVPAKALLGAPAAPAVPAVPREIADIAEKREAVEDLRAGAGRHKLLDIWTPVFLETYRKIVSDEISHVNGLIARAYGIRSKSDITEMLVEFYKTMPNHISSRVGPVLREYCMAVSADALEEIGSKQTKEVMDHIDRFVTGYARVLGIDYSEKSVNQLIEMVRDNPESEGEELMRKRLKEWEETRPEKEAVRETRQAGHAVTRQSWIQSGVKRMMWKSNPNCCDLCKTLNGRTVDIEKEFAPSESQIEAPGMAPIKIYHRLKHPPLHTGCACTIVPA